MKRIKLGKYNKFTIIDDKFEYLKKFNWSLSTNGYAYTANRKYLKFPDIKKKCVYLHRIIFDRYKEQKMYIDHANRNKLDNRLKNLRYATNQLNQYNTNLPKNNTSKYIGVTFCKKTKKWISQIMFNRKNIKIGRFKTKKEAYFAYKNKKNQILNLINI